MTETEKLINTVLSKLQTKYPTSTINWIKTREAFYKDNYAVEDNVVADEIPSGYGTKIISTAFGSNIADIYFKVPKVAPPIKVNPIVTNDSINPEYISRMYGKPNGGKIKSRKIKSRKIKSRKIKSRK